MDIFIIILIILIGIGVLSILFINRHELKKYLVEFEIVAILFLIILIINIQQALLDKDQSIEWSLSPSNNLSYAYRISIPNSSNISIDNVTEKIGNIKIHLRYCVGNEDNEVVIYMNNKYRDYKKQLVIEEKACNQ